MTNEVSSEEKNLRNAPPGRKGRLIPERLLGTRCPECRWRFEEGERYFRDEDDREIHVECRPARVILQYGEEVNTIREPCPACNWPYRQGERVIVSADGIEKHAECPDGSEQTVPATKRRRCEGCGWWIEEGEDHVETLVISQGYLSDGHKVKHSHLDCPDDAPELVAAEKEEEEERKRREAEEERLAREEEERRQRHEAVDEMVELRESLARGELRLGRMEVRIPKGDWAKLVTDVNPDEVNRGGFAFCGAFLDTADTRVVSGGDLIMVAAGSKRSREVDLYRADPTVVEHAESYDGLQHLQTSSGSTWALDMLETVERELEQGPPSHLLPPPVNEDHETVGDTEAEAPEKEGVPASDKDRVSRAIELLTGLGYTVNPPLQIDILEGGFEWD